MGVLDAAEAACGRREGLPALLEGCIAASVEAAFDASLDELSANVSAGGLLSSTGLVPDLDEVGCWSKRGGWKAACTPECQPQPAVSWDVLLGSCLARAATMPCCACCAAPLQRRTAHAAALCSFAAFMPCCTL